jgi:hypothetical protein
VTTFHTIAVSDISASQAATIMLSVTTTMNAQVITSPAHRSGLRSAAPHACRDDLERWLEIVQFVATAFRRTPTLRVTVAEVAGTVGCEEHLAARMFAALTEAGFLTRLGNGVFGRAWVPAAASADPPARRA